MGIRIVGLASCVHHLLTVVQVKMQHFHLPDQIEAGLKRAEAQLRLRRSFA